MSSQENATPLTSPETTPASPIAADTDTSAAQQQPDKEDAEEKITDDGKVTLFFKHVGNAPILKKKKYKISADSSFQEVIKFIKIRLLKLKPTDSLFLYCNQAFCPNPDELVGDLFKQFGTDKMLVINYCATPAWG